MTAHERRPLLPPPTVQGPPADGSLSPALERQRAEDEEGEEDAPPVAQKWTAWTVFWYLVIAALVIWGAVLVVKALVEAKDVDVRVSWCIQGQFSNTWAVV